MSHAPSPALSRRHRTVRDELAARGLDALLVTALPNILYLTNFTGSSATVVLAADRLYFITDSRYIETVSAMKATPHHVPDLELIAVDGSYDATLAGFLASQPWKRIGFEAEHMTVALRQSIAKAIGCFTSGSPAKRVALKPGGTVISLAACSGDRPANLTVSIGGISEGFATSSSFENFGRSA